MPNPSPSTVLALHAGADAALCGALRALCAGCRVVEERFSLDGWLRALYGEPPAGALIDCDGLSLADLHAVAATRRLPGAPWMLLLVGDRGLAGCERLLVEPRTAVLPKPWTSAGLHAALESLRERPSLDEDFPGGFVEGMVEGLRDPLASLSGYLQLLGEDGGKAADGLVRPALAAASDLEQQLHHTRLAARPAAPHAERLDLADAMEPILDDAAAAGIEPIYEAAPGLIVDADPRLLRAALAAGRRLLSRFGPGGRLTLRATGDVDGFQVGWHAQLPDDAIQDPVAPPPYLPLLFERLAARVPATALLDRVDGKVPVTAALRWERS